MRYLGKEIAIATLLLSGCGKADDGAVDRPVVTNIADVDPASIEAIPADEGSADDGAANASYAEGAEPVERRYLGRWTGVEGMYLVVQSRPGGGVRLEMQWDLDHKGTFDGSVTAQGLRFMRNGVAETLVPGDGEATGLKYLADKEDCLTVKSGEGYCRD